jgi:hypothetical protein
MLLRLQVKIHAALASTLQTYMSKCFSYGSLLKSEFVLIKGLAGAVQAGTLLHIMVVPAPRRDGTPVPAPILMCKM